MRFAVVPLIALCAVAVLAFAQPPAPTPVAPQKPHVYRVPPVITALTYSPDGQALAVSGYHEVVLHKSDGSAIVARLLGKSDRVESIVYSPNGKMLAVVGGSPARFGEVQFWDAEKNSLINAAEVAPDSLYGASFSPDGTRLGCGGADNAVRVLSVPDAKVKLKFDNHSDWTFSTTWATDNKHILSTGRDRAIKLIVADTGSFVDDINTHTSPYRAMARHPKGDQVLVAGEDGIPRLYQVFRSTPRTMNQEDHNLLREYPRQNSQINAIAFSRDGVLFAVGGEGDIVTVYTVDNGGEAKPDKPIIGGKPLAVLKGHKGTVHALAFHPDGKQLAVGGFDGMVRLYSLPEGKLIKSFSPVPITK
jgi:WD40 repeat protein